MEYACHHGQKGAFLQRYGVKDGYTAMSGTSTETGVKSENHELKNILDSVDEWVLDTEFINKLDFDRDSIGTNPPDLDDLDIDLEESSI
eukprot:scaffold10139_cov80-Attheya_sp.AAC.3